MRVELMPAVPLARCPSCRPIQAEFQRLLEARKEALGEVAALRQQLEVLQAENLRLKAALEEAERRGKRQSAPFSKGDPKPDPKKPGRKSGEKHGRHGHRDPPAAIDEVVDVPLPDLCPYCGGEIEEDEGVCSQFQSDLPPIRPRVTRFDQHKGRCKRCRKRVRGRDPRQSSDAQGAAGSHVGPRALALAADMNKSLGLSFGKLSDLFASVFQLKFTRGGLAQALARIAQKLEPTYVGLIEAVARAPVVSPDETGWHVGGLSAWLWVFVSVDVTVYLIAPGRSFEDACLVLPADYSGSLARDGWSVYPAFTKARHQSCNTHLLRRCKEILESAQRGAARVPRAVQRLLGDGLKLRDRRDLGEISPHGLRIAKGKLDARAERLLAWNPTDDENRKLLKHLRREHDLGALFNYLLDPALPATNHWAEQEIRPAVVTRKVWGGNRTWDGARTQQILATVLRTGRRQGKAAIPLLVPVLCSPSPRLASLRGLGPDPPQPAPAENADGRSQTP